MQLHICNGTTVSIRSISIVLLLISCVLILGTEIAEADVYVSGNFYYASGIITIGGVALYFIISSGKRGHFSKKKNSPENSMIASHNAMDLELNYEHDDLSSIFNEGRVTIFTW